MPLIMSRPQAERAAAAQLLAALRLAARGSMRASKSFAFFEGRGGPPANPAPGAARALEAAERLQACSEDIVGSGANKSSEVTIHPIRNNH